MVLQTLIIGDQECVVIAKRDFKKLVAQAQLATEDDYWMRLTSMSYSHPK